MQPLTAAPRDGFTAAQVTSVLTGNQVLINAGLELLDTSDALVADISTDLVPSGSTVDRDCTADVQGTCSLYVSRALTWGADRLRPYMTLTAGGLTMRWNLGVYVMTTPQRVVGQSVETYQVQGYDKNYLLQNLIGDTYTVASGTNVQTAVQNVLTASGVSGTLLFDSSAASSTVPADKVWPFSSSEQDSYLKVINDLLALVSYRPLWVDQDGNFRATPNLNPSSAPVEWAFTADDKLQSLVGVARTLTNDLWGAPNSWTFTNTSMPQVSDGAGGTVPKTPTSGDGIYTYTNQSSGSSSVDTLGRTVRAAYFIDAADQTALQAAAQIQIAADQQVTWSVDTTTAVWPGAGHFDVYTLQDSALGGLFKVMATKWSMPLDGGDVSWTWQGAS